MIPNQNLSLLSVTYPSGRKDTIRCDDPLHAKKTKDKLETMGAKVEFIRL